MNSSCQTINSSKFFNIQRKKKSQINVKEKNMVLLNCLFSYIGNTVQLVVRMKQVKL